MNSQSHPQQSAAGELVGELPAPPDTRRLDPATRRAAIVLTAVFWSANVGVATWRAYLEGHPNLGNMFLGRVATAMGGLVLCFAIHLVIARLGHKPFWVRAAALIVMMPFVAEACAWISFFAVEYFAPRTYSASVWSTSALISAIMSWFWFFLAWGALYLALRYSAEVMAAERRARIVQALAHNAQLRALQNQISPHFMFNTLNSISALMLDGAVRAAESMLRQLSEFLRATLALDALSDISLAEELRIQLMYLAIEEARFPDMSVEVDCPDALGDALVPALISQPIVENAVKYGVAGSTGATRIAIAARAVGDQLVLTIEDDGRGQGAQSAGLGVGLRNVRDRLRSRFGEAHRFSAGPRDGGGYRVELSMPLTRAG